MGDGGDGELVDYSAADLPVDFGTEVVEAAPAGDGSEDELVLGGGGVAGANPDSRRPDDEVIELIWAHSDEER